MHADKMFVDELSPAEVEALMDEAEELAYEGIRDPKTGRMLSPDVAKRRVADAKARERRIEIAKAKETRKKVERRRANRDMAKRDKKAKRRKNRK